MTDEWWWLNSWFKPLVFVSEYKSVPVTIGSKDAEQSSRDVRLGTKGLWGHCCKWVAML